MLLLLLLLLVYSDIGVTLLRYLLDKGCPASCNLVLDILLTHAAPVASFAAIAAAVESGDKLGMLHRAVRSGSVAMLTAVLKWAVQHRYRLRWDAPGPLGLSPLHLAALLSRGSSSSVAAAILRSRPALASRWFGLAAEDGNTPARYASKLGLLSLNRLAHSLMVRQQRVQMPVQRPQQQQGPASAAAERASSNNAQAAQLRRASGQAIQKAGLPPDAVHAGRTAAPAVVALPGTSSSSSSSPLAHGPAAEAADAPAAADPAAVPVTAPTEQQLNSSSGDGSSGDGSARGEEGYFGGECTGPTQAGKPQPAAAAAAAPSVLGGSNSSKGTAASLLLSGGDHSGTVRPGRCASAAAWGLTQLQQCLCSSPNFKSVTIYTLAAAQVLSVLLLVLAVLQSSHWLLAGAVLCMLCLSAAQQVVAALSQEKGSVSLVDPESLQEQLVMLLRCAGAPLRVGHSRLSLVFRDRVLEERYCKVGG